MAPTNSAGRSIKRTLQPRKARLWLLLLGEPGSRDNPTTVGYTPSLYGMGEGQRSWGSNGNVHSRGTRGKGGGMLRKKMRGRI